MEEFRLNLFGIICLFSTLQGLILALIFIFNRSTFSKKSNLYLSALLVTFMMLNLVEVFGEAKLFAEYPILHFLPLIWYAIIPPATYFFVQYITDPDYKFKSWGYLMFVPFAVHFGYQCYELFSYLSGGIDLNKGLYRHYFIHNVFEGIAAIFALSISILIFRTLSNYERSLYDHFAEISDKSLKWLSHTLIGGFILILIWLGSVWIDFFPNNLDRLLYQSLFVGLSILIYWIGYSMLMKRELFINQQLSTLSGSAVEGPKLSEKTEDHYQHLLTLMEEKKLFQNPEINMSTLSKEIGLSKGYISQIINAKEDKNFFDFINAYRIAEVKQKMADPDFDHYNILALALDAGFKSKSTFNAVFKKMTGMTPSQFRKQKPPH